MTNFIFELFEEPEELQKQFNQYATQQTALQNMYPNHMIASYKGFQTPEGKQVSISTWSFIPTVLPKTSYSMLALMHPKKTQIYILPQEKFRELLGEYMTAVNEPISHFVINEVPEDIQKTLIENSSLIGEKIHE